LEIPDRAIKVYYTPLWYVNHDVEKEGKKGESTT